MKSNDVMPVPCAAWAEKLAAQPGDLTAEERAALASHILTCPTCASVQAAYSTMDASILSLPPVTPLAELPQLYGIATESQPQEDKHQAPSSAPHPPLVPTGRGRGAQAVPARRHPRRWVRLASAVAAVLVVSALIVGFLAISGAHHAQIGGQNSGSTLYVASRGSDNTVYAVRPSDGAIVWQKQLNDRLTGDLLVVKNTLFAVSSQPGQIYALRKSDGVLLWVKQVTPGNSPPSAGIVGILVTDGQNLYLNSLKTLYAVDIHNGEVVWSRTTSGCPCNGSLAAATGGVVYAYTGDGLSALRASDGKELWHHPGILSSHILLPNKVIVTDGKVYVPLEQQGRVAVLRVSDGRLLRTLTFHSDTLVNSNYIEIAFASGVLYINSSAHDLYALRTSDDTTLWHKHFSDGALYGLSAAYNGTLYFAATSVSVSSISIVDTGKHVTPTPSISTSVASTDIYAINANDGSQRWHLHPTNNDGYASDVLAMDENVYLSVGGRLYALSEKDGRQLWTLSEGINLGTPLTAQG
jgi:outer membrane protein assembly factor BamB